jgi:DNA replication protein DnaC
MKGKLLLQSHLKTLRLPAFAKEYPVVARQCGEEDKSYQEFLPGLCEIEVQQREGRAIARRMKEAGFPAVKDLSDFNFASAPQINKRKILNLSLGEYLDKRENIVLIGPPGVGKTHLAIALGREACRRSKRVKFFTAAGLSTAYAEAREERHVQRLENYIDKRHLVVVDELGYVPLGQGAAENLFHFFSLCYERTSLIITTNLPFSEWPQIFSDERLAGALLDRLTPRVHNVEMKGDSFRLKASLKRREKN